MLTIGLHGVRDPAGAGRSHDHGVAIMRDGAVLFCQELERHTGLKHDGNLEEHIEGLLSPWLQSGGEVRIVLANSFLGYDFRSAGGMLGISGVRELAVPRILAECDGWLRVGSASMRARFFTICHEMAHLGTCLPFFGPFKPHSLLVHIDGGASRSCASAWYCDGRNITCLHYGWQNGLKGAVNNFNDSLLSRRILGVDPSAHLRMPGKLMGLAGLGRADAETIAWLANREWLRDRPPSAATMADELRRGLPRSGFNEFSPRDRGCKVFAACMQTHLEEEVLGYIRTHRDTTRAEHLYCSGGAALNVHANTRIERELGFASVMIPPAPSDAGLALGAAAYFEWSSGSDIREHAPFMNSPPAWAPSDLQPAVPVLRSIGDVSRALAAGKVVGVWVGNAEIGPRALGHRSILARPDSIALRRRVSETMKLREWYRPVAPVMLPEIAIDALRSYRSGSHLARYMLGAWEVVPKCVEAFRGCIHDNGTVRAQVVDACTPELGHIHRLLTDLLAKHGIQGLINTSFNTRGAPIVNGLADAGARAVELGLDALWLPDATIEA